MSGEVDRVDEVGPVEGAARTAVARLGAHVASAEDVLGHLVVSLACAVDKATEKGSASAAAMAGRELRESLAALAAALDTGDDEDPFDRLAREMRESVSGEAGDGRSGS